MRLSSMLFVMLLSSVNFAARAQAGASHPLYVQPPASQACPVGFSADREAGLHAHSTASTAAPQGLGIEINFMDSTSRAIVKADILVHGEKTTAGEGVILTGPTAISRSSTESIQLVGTPNAPLQRSLLTTKNMTAIRWLELVRLEYADGRVWQASAGSRCTATPSLYVPVTATAK